jgi:hypothetical protein
MLSFKKNYFYLPLLALLCSCFPTYKDTLPYNNIPPQNSAVTFYRSGYYKDSEGNDIACYWINKERIDLTDSNLSKDAYGGYIFVENDQIYILGGYKNKNGLYQTCYWVNKERTDLSTPGRFFIIGDFLVHDGQVYTTFMEQDNEENDIPYYSINGKRIVLDSPPNARHIIPGEILIQDGHIYITGHYKDSLLVNTYACYWVDGKRTDLGFGRIDSMYVKDDKIYLGGISYKDKAVYPKRVDHFNDHIRGVCYWVNGEIHKLNTPDFNWDSIAEERTTTVDFIFFQNNNLHFICNKTSWDIEYYNYNFSYLVNGERADITNFGLSSFYSVFTGDDQIYFTYVTWNNRLEREDLYYWANGKKVKINTPNDAEYLKSNRITVKNGKVYISGSYSLENKENNDRKTHFYWVDGKRTDFTSEDNERAYRSYFVIQQ